MERPMHEVNAPARHEFLAMLSLLLAMRSLFLGMQYEHRATRLPLLAVRLDSRAALPDSKAALRLLSLVLEEVRAYLPRFSPDLDEHRHGREALLPVSSSLETTARSSFLACRIHEPTARNCVPTSRNHGTT
jgi:hypothetical protein